MFKNHLQVIDIENYQKVITKVFIPKNLPIMEIIGNLYHRDNVSNSPEVLQISKNLFLGSSGETSDYIRHSCDPNCYLYIVGNRVILYSLYSILSGTEITFDYSTSSTDTLETWKMNCYCNTSKCRKIISGLKYLDPKLIKSYQEQGVIPLFMKETIFR